MVVAWHIAPSAAIMPHHHRTVLPRQEVAVRLVFVPVLIELKAEETKENPAICYLFFHTHQTKIIKANKKDKLRKRNEDVLKHKVKAVEGTAGKLTSGFPSDQRKSPSMVLSFSPIH